MLKMRDNYKLWKKRNKRMKRINQIKRLFQAGWSFIDFMRRQHPIAVTVSIWLIALMAAVVFIPGIIVKPAGVPGNGAVGLPAIIGSLTERSGNDLTLPEDGRSLYDEDLDKPQAVSVYLSKEQRIATMSLEQYVRGVLAAEMPIEFEPEALKAQAIAARTYMIKRMADMDNSLVPVEGAWVTDTEQHQAYLTDQQIEQKWDKTVREANIRKLNQAVEETKGQIMTYEGKPILAVFFSTSNGYTENSEEYWQEELPYLRSVKSPWEAVISPKFKTSMTMTASQFLSKLGLSGGAAAVSVSGASTGSGGKKMPVKITYKILEKSAGGRIKKIRIAGKEFTGREVREKLGLPSTLFMMQAKAGQVELTAIGSGHGVGMSQWGAQGMALKGYKAQDILKHYYSGIRIEALTL